MQKMRLIKESLGPIKCRYMHEFLNFFLMFLYFLDFDIQICIEMDGTYERIKYFHDIDSERFPPSYLI